MDTPLVLSPNQANTALDRIEKPQDVLIGSLNY
jgi:hypothetical protein